MKDYLLSVISAAMICSLVSVFIPKDSAYSSIIKLICGLFIAVTAISPLLNFRLDSYYEYWNDIQSSANDFVDGGEVMANEASRDIIKSQSEAYILDKASLMGLTVKVEVTLTDSIPPSPYSVEIKGAVSPYQKQKLKKLIQDELAIPEERQTWT